MRETTTRFSSGDDPEGLAAISNIADGSVREKYPDWIWAIAAQGWIRFTSPVGQFRPNAWGQHDMHGNAWEWCSDRYAADYYKHSPVDDPSGPAESAYRVFRGGGWNSFPHSASLCVPRQA